MSSPELKQSVIDAYRAYMAAYERAYETNDTSTLAQYAVDPVLGQVVRDIQANAAKHVIWRFHNVLNPQIQAWLPDKTVVLVLDCLENLGSYEYSLSDGSRLSTKKAANNYFQAQMKYVQGAWKITDARAGNQC